MTTLLLDLATLAVGFGVGYLGATLHHRWQAERSDALHTYFTETRR